MDTVGVNPRELSVGDEYLAPEHFGGNKELRKRIVSEVDICGEGVRIKDLWGNDCGWMDFDRTYWRESVLTKKKCHEAIKSPAVAVPSETEEFPQNPSPYRFDLIPAKAMLRIAEIIAYGDKKHGRYNWKKIPAEVHHGRSEAHMTLARVDDKSEDHYGHAAVRAIFALSQAIDEGKA